MDKPAKEIPLEEALEVFRDWMDRASTIIVVIGFAGDWGETADGVVEKVFTSPGQSGIQFWSLTEGLPRQISFADATFFRLLDLESAPESLRSDWHSFLLVRFQDDRRLLFAERRSD